MADCPTHGKSPDNGKRCPKCSLLHLDDVEMERIISDRAELTALRAGLAQASDKLAISEDRRQELIEGLAKLTQHRDAWRRCAYGQGPRPSDFVSGNLSPDDRPALTAAEERDQLRADFEATIRVQEEKLTTLRVALAESEWSERWAHERVEELEKGSWRKGMADLVPCAIHATEGNRVEAFSETCDDHEVCRELTRLRETRRLAVELRALIRVAHFKLLNPSLPPQFVLPSNAEVQECLRELATHIDATLTNAERKAVERDDG